MNHDIGMRVELKLRNIIGAEGRSEYFMLDADFLNNPTNVFYVTMAILYTVQKEQPEKRTIIVDYLDTNAGNMVGIDKNNENARELIENFIAELDKLI